MSSGQSAPSSERLWIRHLGRRARTAVTWTYANHCGSTHFVRVQIDGAMVSARDMHFAQGDTNNSGGAASDAQSRCTYSSTACLTLGFRSCWRVNPRQGVARPAGQQSEALRVKGIDNFTSGQVRSRLRPACGHGVAPVRLSPTPRFVEHHVDCKKCQLIETRRRGAARNTLCNSRIRIYGKSAYSILSNWSVGRRTT